MAKFKTTMSGDKFKKAVHGLPDDPTQGEEFLAFRATKDGDKENIYVGLYVGTNMKSDFAKDKAAYKAPTLFKGTLHRSAKHPAKKLILESTATLPPLKELGKECLKATKLPLVIAAIKPGDPEADPTAEELAEMGLAPTCAASSDSPGSDADGADRAASADNSCPDSHGTDRSTSADSPRSDAHGADCSASSDRPCPHTQHPVTQPANSSLAQFKARLKNLMGPIRDATTLNADIGIKAGEAIKCGQTDPVKAMGLLDAIEVELETIGKKKENVLPLKAAKVLRETWDEVAAAGLETDSILLARRTAALAALKKRDAKSAMQAIQALKDQIEPVKTARDESRRLLVGRWIVRQFEDPNINPRFMSDAETKLWAEKTTQFTKDFNVSEEMAREMMETALKDLRKQADAINPMGGVVNPIIPDESRPQLTRQEMLEASSYVGGHYADVNPALWKNEIPPPPFDEMHKQLQEAFKKTKPFPRPIRVTRGVDFQKPAELDAYLKPFKKAEGTDQLVPLLGYISTGTAGTPPLFRGNIEFTIIAKQGLDMTPYTGAGNAMSKEKELCLNHATLVKVHRVKATKKGVWHVQVEQILPSGNV